MQLQLRCGTDIKEKLQLHRLNRQFSASLKEWNPKISHPHIKHLC